MADITAIRNALAAQITARTGLRALGQARDTVNPPCAVILPGSPLIRWGATLDGTVDISLNILLVISDAPPVQMTQRALDAYLGIGAGEPESIPAALMADPTLGGACHYAIPATVDQYSRVEYGGVGYFGARLSVTIGAI